MASKYTALQKFVFNVLRRASLRWPPKNMVKVKARVQRGKYICANCQIVYPPKDIRVDHIDPVIDPREGFVGWDTYINRLFCGMDGLQVLCTTCHALKTREENAIRRQ